MLYVKAIFGNIYHNAFNLLEGAIQDVEDAVCKTAAVLELESKGIIKICKTYEEAVAFKFRGYSALAMESLPFLNPPIDEKTGKSLLIGSPTMDIAKGEPLQKEFNYIPEPEITVIDTPVVVPDPPVVVLDPPAPVAVAKPKTPATK